MSQSRSISKGAGDMRSGDDRITWYTNGFGDVIRTVYFSYYTPQQMAIREAGARVLHRAMYKASPLLRRIHGL